MSVTSNILEALKGMKRDEVAELIEKLGEQEKAKPRQETRGVRRNKAKIMAYVDKHGSITVGEVREVIGATGSGSHLYLQRLIEDGLLVSEGLPRYNRFFRPGTVLEEVEGSRVSQSQTKVENDNRFVWGEKVLQYVSDHMGETYSIGKMGRDLGMAPGVIYSTVRALDKRHLLPHNFNIGTTPLEAQVEEVKTEEPQVVEEAPASDDFTTQVECLIWKFVRETRSTDVLLFVTWLEQRNKSKE